MTTVLLLLIVVALFALVGIAARMVELLANLRCISTEIMLLRSEVERFADLELQGQLEAQERAANGVRMLAKFAEANGVKFPPLDEMETAADAN